MKAFVATRYGKKEKLQQMEVATPTVKPDEVLVQVSAAGVNSLDALIRNGDFKLFIPYKPPFALGHDVAGCDWSMLDLRRRRPVHTGGSHPPP